MARGMQHPGAMTSFTTATLGTPSDSAALGSVLSEFLRHLCAGDTAAAAALWDVPALILGDEHAHGPLSRERLAEMLADMPGPGALDGAGTRGEPARVEARIERVEQISQRVTAIDARWPQLRRGGLLHGIDAATFLVRIDEHGHPKIRGLLLRSAR